MKDLFRFLGSVIDELSFIKKPKNIDYLKDIYVVFVICLLFTGVFISVEYVWLKFLSVLYNW